VLWAVAPSSFTGESTPSPGAAVILEARGGFTQSLGFYLIVIATGIFLFTLHQQKPYSDDAEAPSVWAMGPLIMLILLGVLGVLGFLGNSMPLNTQYIVDKNAGVPTKDEYFLFNRSRIIVVKLNQIERVEYHHWAGSDLDDSSRDGGVIVWNFDGTKWTAYSGAVGWSRRLALAINQSTGIPVKCFYAQDERDCSILSQPY